MADRFWVSRIDVLGSSLLDPAWIREHTSPYASRYLSYAELLDLRDSLTRAYVERGYVNSGATLEQLPDADGVLELRIVEGALTELEIRGQRYFREPALRARMARHLGKPLDVFALENDLRLLQQDDRIRRVEAELIPSSERGAARLILDVEENSPLALEFGLDNRVSPAIADRRVSLDLAHANLTGRGDRLRAGAQVGEGLSDVSLGYRHPLPLRGAELEWSVRTFRSEILERPFEDLDIESRSATYGLALHYAAYQSPGASLALSLGFEKRRSRSFLLGRGFPFAEGVERDGTTKLSVLELGQDFTYRDPRQVVALRSSLRLGIDALGSTIQGDALPDSRFVALRLQVQWARRLPVAGATLVARADAQLTNDPLLGVEQFGIGGANSVRGYRESARLGDNGWLASLEVRAPIELPFARRAAGASPLEASAFVDAGRVWNQDRSTPRVRTLSSVGVGVAYTLRGGWRAELSLSHDLRRFDVPGRDERLQDRGLLFRVSRSM